MHGVADIFRNRQDGFDDGAEELGDLRRPRRDDAAERRALARHAGHVRFLLGGRARVFAGEAITRTFSALGSKRTRPWVVKLPKCCGLGPRYGIG